MKKNVLLLVGLIAISISAFITAVNENWGLHISHILLMILRWLSIGALVLYAFQKKSLTTWILLSMVIGAEVGHDFPVFSQNLKVISKVFLKLIKTIIGPLIFGTLVVGIAGHSNLKQVGRMGWKSLVYFEIVTTIALFIGLAAINISGAGKGELHEQYIAAQATANAGKPHEELPDAKPQTWQEIILHAFPENIAKSVAEGQVLQIVIFSIIFGIGLAMVKDAHKRQPMLSFAESLSEVMFKFTNVVMFFAPFAIGAAMAVTVGHMGISVLQPLFILLGTLYAALAVFLVLLLIVALIVRMPIKRFIQVMAEPVSIAFATTSSEAALPKAMEAMVSLGVPRKIVAFVMPMGYSFNLDGTTLYLSLATIFVANVAGIPLSFGQQLLIVFTLMLTSKGVAGVPRASLIILLGTAVQFGLPVEPIFLILAIDELMDMARTSVNVIGNCLATYVIARWENDLDEPIIEPVSA
ncbi:MAG: cation:dicarboxylase symporter family transporter [Chitinophagales bacterium]|nr:cation:dicarboxylase symporter family transporter [Chitinophagales bacterium]